MPEFYMIIAPKIFFPNLGERPPPTSPTPPTPMEALLRQNLTPTNLIYREKCQRRSQKFVFFWGMKFFWGV